MRILISIAAVLMLVTSMAGCSGGQGGNKQQDSKDGQGKQTQGKQSKQGAKPGEETVGKDKAGRPIKRVSGIVAKVEAPNHRVWIKPANEKARVFVYRPDNFKMKLDGEDAQPEGLKKDQRAALLFQTVKAPKQNVDQDIALSMSAVSSKGGSTGEKTN